MKSHRQRHRHTEEKGEKKAKKNSTGKWEIYLPDDVETELCFSLP